MNFSCQLGNVLICKLEHPDTNQEGTSMVNKLTGYHDKINYLLGSIDLNGMIDQGS